MMSFLTVFDSEGAETLRPYCFLRPGRYQSTPASDKAGVWGGFRSFFSGLIAV